MLNAGPAHPLGGLLGPPQFIVLHIKHSVLILTFSDEEIIIKLLIYLTILISDEHNIVELND